MGEEDCCVLQNPFLGEDSRLGVASCLQLLAYCVKDHGWIASVDEVFHFGDFKTQLWLPVDKVVSAAMGMETVWGEDGARPVEGPAEQNVQWISIYSVEPYKDVRLRCSPFPTDIRFQSFIAGWLKAILEVHG
jgi:hypothetical protein